MPRWVQYWGSWIWRTNPPDPSDKILEAPENLAMNDEPAWEIAWDAWLWENKTRDTSLYNACQRTKEATNLPPIIIHDYWLFILRTSLRILYDALYSTDDSMQLPDDGDLEQLDDQARPITPDYPLQNLILLAIWSSCKIQPDLKHQITLSRIQSCWWSGASRWSSQTYNSKLHFARIWSCL